LPSEIATPPLTVSSGVTIQPFLITKSAFMIIPPGTPPSALLLLVAYIEVREHPR
jgi:hypothetical protein